MPRPTPEAPDYLTWKAPAPQKTLSLTIRLITPMFGGGFDPGVIDLANPIRAAAVRGHLRFWWRATAGARYANLQALQRAETALWGSTEQPGKVITRTALTADSQQILQKTLAHPPDGLRSGTCLPQCAEYVWNREQTELKALPEVRHGFPPYALQPFQGARDANKVLVEKEPSMGLVDVDFELRLTFSAAAQEEVLSAVAAWIRYGGLGARTRRGCGSLKCIGSDAGAMPAIQLAESVANLPEDLTILQDSTILFGAPRQDPISAWSEAVKLYQQFRQTGEQARDPGPGRSKWPEPNTIRHKLGPARHWAHSIPPGFIAGFPRADLGLPIIFHFKDRTDPEETTLQADGVQSTRFASPVITKAVPEGNQYRPMILILNSPPAWHNGPLVLKGGPNVVTVSRADIEMTPANRTAVPPLAGQTARKALEAYVLAQGWSRGAAL